MKKLPKQDKSGSRTPTDVERRYDFKKLDKIDSTQQQINELKTNKVDKVAGKSLSTNDYTNTDKQNVDNNTEARHTHNNKEILDSFTMTGEEIETLVNGAVEDAHTHTNKTLLDSYTQSNTNLTNAVNNSHTHSNKSYLDSITGGTTEFNLSSYLGSGVSLLRGTCVSKNRRVCINAVVSKAINAKTTTTIFNLPTSLTPSTQKDGVVFGTTSDGSTCGWYNISTSGAVTIWFPVAVTTYSRLNVCYDIDY